MTTRPTTRRTRHRRIPCCRARTSLLNWPLHAGSGRHRGHTDRRAATTLGIIGKCTSASRNLGAAKQVEKTTGGTLSP